MNFVLGALTNNYLGKFLTQLCKVWKGKSVAVLVVVGVMALFIGLLAVAPGLKAAPVEEKDETETPGPSPNDAPFFEDDFSGIDYPRRDGVPSTGDPHIKVTELKGRPEVFNQVKLKDAQWLEDGIAHNGQPVRLYEDSMEQFFEYYEQAGNKIPYFEVTMPDGSISSYYDVRFLEIP